MNEYSAKSLLDFVRETAPAAGGKDGKAALERLEERYSQLQAAMEWLINNGRTDDGIRLATALSGFWMATKRLAEGGYWFDRVLGAPGGTDSVLGRGVFQAGLLAIWRGEDERAVRLFEQALEIGRRSSDHTVSAQALTGLARVRLRSGDTAEAKRLCREAIAVTEGTDDPSGRSNAMHVLGVAAQMAGDFEEAREVMTERISVLRAAGQEVGVAAEASNLSMVERQLGNLGRAEELSREALEIYSRRGDEWSIPWALNGLAAIAVARGELRRAAHLFGAAEAMVEAQDAAWPPDERPHYEKTAAALTAGLSETAFEKARAIGRAIPTAEAVKLALRGE